MTTMNIKVISLFLSLVFFSTLLFAQNNEEILLTINNEVKVTKAEFERIYKKNNSNNEASADAKSLDDYVQLFINFKLKVLEAQKLGIDTSKNFVNELKGYRAQLAKPYLTDKDADEKIVAEAYERMKKDIRASHILLKCDPAASPKDSLLAYNNAIKIRNRLIAGEDFGKVAASVSEDPSAKNNHGDLGFFTAFQMVYPFETAAYKLQKDEISMPVRSAFGYHIIKVTDSRENAGQIKVAHIMAATPKDANMENISEAKTRIFEVYEKLKKGEDFSAQAELFSDDKGSAKQGGELPWFSTGRMVPEFEIAAFSLKNKGDFSEPVQTSFGWHIIKLIDKKPLGSFNDLKNEIKNKIARDVRSDLSKKSMIQKLKNEYAYSYIAKNLDEIIKFVDITILEGTWKKDAATKLNKKLFVLNNIEYSQNLFVDFLAENQKK
jgi:peptidyl-prolyl cis-trans isomerase SurA